MIQTILVIDDDEGILEVVQLVLESEGYQVQARQYVEDFQSLIEGLPILPDLVLLDVLLAGKDGRELCQQLKRDQTTRHIPVIMLTAHAAASTFADSSGADDFIEKPFDVDDLIEVIKKHLPSTTGQKFCR